jgi:hypothetical protein
MLVAASRGAADGLPWPDSLLRAASADYREALMTRERL